MSVGTGNTVSGNWYNKDGLPVYFPGHYADAAQRTNKPTAVTTYGVTRQIVMPFDLSKMAATTTSYTTDLANGGVTTGFTEHDPHMPAGSVVTAVRVVVTTAAAGGTSITIGGYEQNGTILSANAYMTTSVGTTANLAVGNLLTGDGTYNTVSSNVVQTLSTTHNIWPAIVTAGTFTAGAGFIIIDYVDIASNPELSSNTP